MKPTLSLVMCLRDEEENIERAILSLIDYVDEFVWLDMGSFDSTPDICAKYGRGIRLVTSPDVFDFGQAKTTVSWCARGEYVFLLDGDEIVTGADHLPSLVEELDTSGFRLMVFPRRRWLDVGMTTQIELEAYPDWQARLYKNDTDIRWTGALHEALTDAETREATVRDGKTYQQQGHMPHIKSEALTIEHFVDPLHLADPVRREARARQRRVLALRAGVPTEGSAEAAWRAGVGVHTTGGEGDVWQERRR